MHYISINKMLDMKLKARPYIFQLGINYRNHIIFRVTIELVVQ